MTGAQRGDVREDAINLAIAREVRTLLIEQGASVIMTRDGDHDLAGEDAENRKREDMQQRVAIINCGWADAFISIHLNAYTSANVHGAQVFYQEENAASKQMAQQIQQQLSASTDTKMSAKPGDYYILEKPSVPVYWWSAVFFPTRRNENNCKVSLIRRCWQRRSSTE